nr:APC family permease [Actinoplanes humidus]
MLTNALARNRLGVASVVFFVMSAAAPLTVVAGVVPTGLAVTGLTAISIAFVTVALVLAVFSVGYVAMARHIANAGAFYAYVSRGLGRPLGVAAAWVALAAYNSFQVASYGGIGAIAAPLFAEWFGIQPPWWLIALAAWALVAVLGVRDVAVNGKVLATLLVAEIILVVLFSFADLTTAGFVPSAAPLDPGGLAGAGAGALLVMAVTGFVGFEQSVVFSEESRDPRRTVPRATYLSILLITALYAFSAWAMISAAGPDAVHRATTEGPELFFTLPAAQLGDLAVDLGHALFLTSLIAAMISFHNIIARYTFSLGREGVLPRTFGRTVPATGAPKNGSLAQSAFGLLVILTYALLGWDPLVQLFFWGGTTGALGVLLLITVTSAAVIGFFLRTPCDETLWRRAIAPTCGTLLLLAITTAAFTTIATLFGVTPGSPPTWTVPLAYTLLAAAGATWALTLRLTRPTTYEGIGWGARSTRFHPTEDPPPTDPQPTDPQLSDSRPGDSQLTDPQLSDSRPGDLQPIDSRPGGSQPGDLQPMDSRPVGPQPGDLQPMDSRPGGSQPGDFRPSDSPRGTIPDTSDSRPSNSPANAAPDITVPLSAAPSSNLPGTNVAAYGVPSTGVPSTGVPGGGAPGGVSLSNGGRPSDPRDHDVSGGDTPGGAQ